MTIKSEHFPRESLRPGLKQDSGRSSGRLFPDSPPCRKVGLLAISRNRELGGPF